MEDYYDFQTSAPTLTKMIVEDPSISVYLSNRQSVTVIHSTPQNYTLQPDFTPVISPPCCGKCTIDVNIAQVVYWPTPALQPNISTINDLNGFVLYVSFNPGVRMANDFFSTSPLAYVIYPNVTATNLCGTVGSKVDITWSYRPGELSSLTPSCRSNMSGLPTPRVAIAECDHVYSVFNFADLNSCSYIVPNASDSCSPYITFKSVGFTPQTMQPKWATCMFDFSKPYWDPPIALTSAAGLRALSITVPTPSQTTSATAGAVPPAIHTKTPPPEYPPLSTPAPASARVGDPLRTSLSSVNDPSSQEADALVPKIGGPGVKSNTAESNYDPEAIPELQNGFRTETTQTDRKFVAGQVIVSTGIAICDARSLAASTFSVSISTPLYSKRQSLSAVPFAGVGEDTVSSADPASATLGISGVMSKSGNSSSPIVPFLGDAKERLFIRSWVLVMGAGGWLLWWGSGL